MKIRNFTIEDLPALIKLLNKNYKDAYEFVPYSEGRLLSWIQEGTLKIVVAEEKETIVGSAAYHDGYWGEEIEWLVTRSNFAQKNIENELVKEVEKYVKSGKVFTAVDAGSPKIAEWTERGYNVEGGLYHMIIKLDKAKPIPKVPEGIILRSMRINEEKEFIEAINAGFGWERLKVGIIEMWKADCPPFNEDWVHVAEVNKKIVSAVVSRPDVDYNQHFNGKRGYLGPAATVPEYQNKGLVSALTCRAMNFLLEKGMDSAALYTSEQNFPSVVLLQKLGFKIGHHWKFLRKNKFLKC